MPVMYHQRGGVDGILDTLNHMQRLTNNAYTHELIRAQAAKAIAHCHVNDRRCQAASLSAWVQRKMHFVRDPVGVEALHDPIAVALAVQRGQRPHGDCDDFSMYLAALMKSVGIPATFRAAGYNGSPLRHVYVVGPYGAELDPTRDLWNPGLGELLPRTSHLDMPV